MGRILIRGAAAGRDAQARREQAGLEREGAQQNRSQVAALNRTLTPASVVLHIL